MSREPVNTLLEWAKAKLSPHTLESTSSVEEKAAFLTAYDHIKQQYRDKVEKRMRDKTWTESVIQLLAAGGSAYYMTRTSSSSSTFNPLALAQRLFAPFNTRFNNALNIAVAGTTFALVYEAFERKGEGRAYSDLLAQQIANHDYSNLIQQAFTKITNDMVSAFCLREERLQQEKNNQQKINGDYTQYLRYLFHDSLQVIVNEHQKDIANDATQWNLWKKFISLFYSAKEREMTTQQIQLGLLPLITYFHNKLAEEKNWRGKHPILYSIAFATLGGALGFLGVAFVPFLATMLWPVAATAVAGTLIFGGLAYYRAKKSPYKRSDREQQFFIHFANTIKAEQTALEQQLNQQPHLDAEQQKVITTCANLTGYFTESNAARGAPKAWIRYLSPYLANPSKILANDITPAIRLIAEAAERQNELLHQALLSPAQNNAFLQQYIAQTQDFLKENRLVNLTEKIKEQILTAVGQLPPSKPIPPAIRQFYEQLQGNSEHLDLAHHFCPFLPEQRETTVYNNLLSTADRLQQYLSSYSEPLFSGDCGYWQALSSTVSECIITDDNIDNLLANTKRCLTQINLPAQRGTNAEAHYSEAYYLYRTLLLRQFAVLVMGEKINKSCQQKILQFIKRTWHLSSISTRELLSDVYYQDLYQPESSTGEYTSPNYPHVAIERVAYIAEAMRLDLTYHHSFPPTQSLQFIIATWVKNKGEDFLLFGHNSPNIGAKFNFLTNKEVKSTVEQFISNTNLLLTALNGENNLLPENTPPVNLYYVYKSIITRQTLMALKCILLALEQQQDEARISDLTEAFKETYQFLISSSCYSLTRSLTEETESRDLLTLALEGNKGREVIFPAKEYLDKLYSICEQREEFLAWVKQHHGIFRLDEIYEGDFGDEEEHSLASVQKNRVLLRPTSTREMNRDTVWVDNQEAAHHDEIIAAEQNPSSLSLYAQIISLFQSYLGMSSEQNVSKPTTTLAMIVNDPGLVTTFVTEYKDCILRMDDTQQRQQVISELKQQLFDYLYHNPSFSLDHYPALAQFYNTLGLSDDLMVLTKKYQLKSTDEDAALLFKAVQQQGDNLIFYGTNSDWQALSLSQELPSSYAITDMNIDALLNNTTLFLRRLSLPVTFQINYDKELKEHSCPPVYSIYRFLLLRQFAHLLRDETTPRYIKLRIEQFIQNTLNTEISYVRKMNLSQEDMKRDLFMDFAQQHVIHPGPLLDKTLYDYLNSSECKKPIFGDPDPRTLARLQLDKPDTVKLFIQNSLHFMSQLQTTCSWNKAPVRLIRAYQQEISVQIAIILIELHDKLIENKGYLESFNNLYDFYTQNCLTLQDEFLNKTLLYIRKNQSLLSSAEPLNGRVYLTYMAFMVPKDAAEELPCIKSPTPFGVESLTLSSTTYGEGELKNTITFFRATAGIILFNNHHHSHPQRKKSINLINLP